MNWKTQWPGFVISAVGWALAGHFCLQNHFAHQEKEKLKGLVEQSLVLMDGYAKLCATPKQAVDAHPARSM